MYTAQDLIASARKHKMFCFDVEHAHDTNLSATDFKLHGMGFATEEITVYLTDMTVIREVIRNLFPDDDIEAIAYNAKYDLKCLKAVGIIDSHEYPNGIRDPMIGYNLLDENRQQNKMKLEHLVLDIFGYQMQSYMPAWEAGGATFEAYAKDDVYWELKLYKHLKPMIVREGLWGNFIKIRMRILLVVSDLEYVGFYWDLDRARELLHGYQKLRDKYETEIHELIGNVNIKSGPQMSVRLFDELGYSTRGLDKVPTGKWWKLDADALDTLSRRYPVAHKIKQFRTASQMIGTYVEPLSRMAMDDPNSRIHSNFWLISLTGRTRNTNPNLQNQPARLDKIFDDLSIRTGFVPRDGFSMIVSDLSQIELRVCAHVTGDPGFTKAYTDWQCKSCGASGSNIVIQHTCPNCGVYEDEDNGFWHGLDLHQQTTDQVSALQGNRSYGKQCNFSLIYAASGRRMWYEYPDFSEQQWNDIVEQFLNTYSGVKRYHQRMKRLLNTDGVVTNIFGRKRRITREELKKHFKHCFNQFVNFPIQSAAFEYIAIALVNLRQQWIDEGIWNTDAYFVNFIHDEVVVECKHGMEAKVKKDVVYHLEHAVQMSVPVRADIKTVANWNEMK